MDAACRSGNSAAREMLAGVECKPSGPKGGPFETQGKPELQGALAAFWVILSLEKKMRERCSRVEA